MRLYNVKPIEKEFQFGKMSVVTLGEKGRGRQETLIPFHADNIEGNNFEIAQTRTGKSKIIKGSTSSPGWIAVLSGSGCYTRGTYGTVYVPENQKQNIEVLAKGYGAYGAAGRVGDWNEFLVAVRTMPTVFYVRPAGGRHKMNRYWLVFDKDQVFRVDEEERDIYVDQSGVDLIEIEEGFPGYVDLMAG